MELVSFCSGNVELAKQTIVLHDNVPGLLKFRAGRSTSIHLRFARLVRLHLRQHIVFLHTADRCKSEFL